ncbi:MAG: glycosyltransferase [Gammaproteobacteria bacterium]
MARILQCWELGDGYAYLDGSTAGARVLKAAGYEVALAYRDLKHAERVVGTDFELFQAPTPQAGLYTQVRQPMTFADQLINVDYGDTEHMLGRLRAWRTLIKRFAPDVLRVLHSPGALLASRGLGIPTVVTGTGFLIPPPAAPLPNLRPWAKHADVEAMRARETNVLDAMNRALERLGAPLLTRIADLYQVDVQELYTFPEMDEYGPRNDVEYMGVYQPESGAAPQWPARGSRRVFVYLDPFEHLPDLLRILKQSDCSTLAFIPQLPLAVQRELTADNLAFADKPLNMFETTRQCDFGITHSGHNIAITLLLAGKPQFVLPLRLPERISAENVLRLGAGLMFAPEADPLKAGLDQMQRDGTLLAAKAQEFAARQPDCSRAVIDRRRVQHIEKLIGKTAL